MNKEGQISEECYEALKKVFEEDIEERTARVEKESSNVYDLYESSEEFRNAIERLSVIHEESAERLLEQTSKVCESFAEYVEQIIESLVLRAEALEYLDEVWNVRPPSEIKKELKHEKNPMRRKQLNRELNESYRLYRRK